MGTANRYRWLLLVAAALLPGLTEAQDFPARPLRLIIPFAPGGATDIVGRIVGKGLEKPLGQAVVIENRPGGGTLIGVEAAARAAPDGYTLLLGGTNVPGLVIYVKDLSVNVQRDLASVGLIAEQGIVFAASAKAPFNNYAEMLAYARANPGKLNYGTTGPGTTEIYLAMLEQQTGIKIERILYKGAGPYTTALLAGEIDLAYLSIAPAAGYLKDGKVKLLTVTGRQRAPELPAVPTYYEVGVQGLDTNWFGLMAPGATPRAAIARVNAAAQAALRDAEVREQLQKQGMTVITSSPEEMARVLGDNIERWTAVAKSAGIHPQ